MLNFSIKQSLSILSGPSDQLREIHAHFSFKDKSAESQLARWKKGLFWKEKALYAQHGELPESYIEWKKQETERLRENILVHATQFVTEKGQTTLGVPTGLAESVVKYAESRGMRVNIADERDFDIGKRLLSGVKPPTLRRPQQAALDILTSERNTLVKGTGLIRLATGVGKTALGQELIRHFGVRSIFLVPSLPILEQTIKRFEDAFGKKNVRAYGGGAKNVGYVTVATYQSVFKGDPKDFEDVALIIADECHHVSADTFYDVMMVKLKNAVHRYGLTAFEERADNSTMLIESAVGPVVYKFDAPEAIKEGFLAQPTFQIYQVYETRGQWTKYSIKGGKRTATATKISERYNGDDDLVAYRNWVLGNDKLNEYVAGLVNGFVGQGSSVLILVDEKEHGDRLMQLIPGAGFAIGGGKDNKRLQKEFNARKLKVLIGTSTLGEGADTVPVDILINLQGGASKSKTLQAVGRGLRNETDENGVAQKPHVLVIDFEFPLCDMLNRHSLIRQKIYENMGDVHKSKL